MNKRTQWAFIEPIVRAVIVHRGRILLCRVKGKRYFFLPGGHVEFRETLERALHRELREELGVAPATVTPLGVVQNFFVGGRRRYHELNFLYRVALPRYDINGYEDHIAFHWRPVSQIGECPIKPDILRRVLPAYLRKRKFFFVTEQ